VNRPAQLQDTQSGATGPRRGSDTAVFTPGGARDPRSRLAPPRRVRMPDLLVGLMIVVVCMLGGVLVFLNVTEAEEALTLARPIHRGEVLTVDHLSVVELSTSSDIGWVSPRQAGTLVGKVAATSMAPGVLLTPEQFNDPIADLSVQEALVGLLLEPGPLPVANLVPGDLVSVLSTSQQSVGNEPGAGRILADRVLVHDIQRGSTTSQALVTLRMPYEYARQVATGADEGQIRLLIVGTNVELPVQSGADDSDDSDDSDGSDRTDKGSKDTGKPQDGPAKNSNGKKEKP